MFEAKDVILWSELPDLEEGIRENPHGMALSAPDPKDNNTIRTYELRAQSAEEIEKWYRAILNSTKPKLALAQRAFNAKSMAEHAANSKGFDTIQYLVEYKGLDANFCKRTSWFTAEQLGGHRSLIDEYELANFREREARRLRNLEYKRESI